jgi:hypothetical protein
VLAIDCAGPGSLNHESMSRTIGVGVALLALCLASAYYFQSNPDEHQHTDPIEELAARIVKMKNWHLAGAPARKQMEKYFDKQNFHAEAKHFEHFVNSHPFFGEGGMYDLPAEVHLSKDLPFRVAGFPINQNRFYHGQKVMSRIAAHPVLKRIMTNHDTGRKFIQRP